MYRLAKYQPWYHQARPRCATTTLAGVQCVFSASHVGRPHGKRPVYLCTTHSKMADFPVKSLEATRVAIRED
jgi:hypothetical protein